METKLLPCPFCGGEAESHRRINHGLPFSHGVDFWVSCTGNCGAATCRHESEEQAEEAWNTRAVSPYKSLCDELAPAIAIVIEKCVGLWDEGPADEGWQSKELEYGLGKMSEFLAKYETLTKEIKP